MLVCHCLCLGVSPPAQSYLDRLQPPVAPNGNKRWKINESVFGVTGYIEFFRKLAHDMMRVSNHLRI